MVGRRRGSPEDIDPEDSERKDPVSEPPPPQADIEAGWVGVATVENQKLDPKYAGMWKEGPPTCETFDILSEEGLQAYKQLLRDTHPIGSPKKVLLSELRYQIGESVWFVIHYQDILYRKLI